MPGPRARLGRRVQAGARLHGRDRRQRDPLHGRRGADRSSGRRRKRTFIANLTRAADLARDKNVTLLIEPINPRDRPNYFLTRVEQAADIIAKVGKPNVKIQFDFYHVQIMSGDLIKRFEKHLPLVGHVQIAAVPSRAEPDEGEINYPARVRGARPARLVGLDGLRIQAPRRAPRTASAGAQAYGLGAARFDANAGNHKGNNDLSWFARGRGRLLNCAMWGQKAQDRRRCCARRRAEPGR